MAHPEVLTAPRGSGVFKGRDDPYKPSQGRGDLKISPLLLRASVRLVLSEKFCCKTAKTVLSCDRESKKVVSWILAPR